MIKLKPNVKGRGRDLAQDKKANHSSQGVNIEMKVVDTY